MFDNAVDIRKAAGEIGFQVLTSAGDSNHVIHFSRWDSLAGARLFFESHEVAEIRGKAGVQTPMFTYLDERDRGDL